jgi:DNA repair exonuclease SbcCD ATPase subunit
MTNTATAPRRLSAKQLSKALMEIDYQIAALRIIENQFGTAFAEVSQIPTAVGEAWNATHDAIEALTERRAEVQANRKPFTAAERAAWALIAANID